MDNNELRRMISNMLREGINQDIFTDPGKEFLQYVQSKTPELYDTVKQKIANRGLEKAKEFYTQYDPEVLKQNRRKERNDGIKQKNQDKKNKFLAFKLDKNEFISMIQQYLINDKARHHIAASGCPQIALGAGDFKTNLSLFGLQTELRTMGLEYYDVEQVHDYISKMENPSTNDILDNILSQQKRIKADKQMLRQYKDMGYYGDEDSSDFEHVRKGESKVKAKSEFEVRMQVTDRPERGSEIRYPYIQLLVSLKCELTVDFKPIAKLIDLRKFETFTVKDSNLETFKQLLAEHLAKINAELVNTPINLD